MTLHVKISVLLGWIFSALLLMNLGCTDLKPSNRLPNIILILADDLGYNDLGSFGSANPTPHLDNLANEGALLTHYYATQAVCSASRASLLTGCYPNRIGIHQALMPGSEVGINPAEETLAELLKEQGYKTAIYGKWHLGDHHKFLPLQHGFDEYYGIPYSNDMWPFHPQQGPVFNFPPLPLYQGNDIIDTLEDQTNLTVELTEKSVDFIKRNAHQPFFLYVPHPQPHVPLYVSDRFKGKSGRGLYGDVIMEIDWSVGEIIKALEEENLTQNTLIIFTSDNGPWLSYGNHSGSAHPLREGKGTTWEGGQRVPFIIKYPSKVIPGEVINTPVMGIDLLPTIIREVGGRMPKKKIDGKEIWPILTGDKKEMVHPAYYFYYNVNELQAVMAGEWKLYFPHRYRSMQGQEPGKDGIPGNYTHFTLENKELYNLHKDLSETQNLASEFPALRDSLSEVADSIRMLLGDKLLNLEGKETRLAGRISN